MDELRWSLLIIGIAVVAGVYWWGRRRRGSGSSTAEVEEAPSHSSLWEDPDDAVVARELQSLGRMIEAEKAEQGGRDKGTQGNAPSRQGAQSTPQSSEERVIALFVFAGKGQRFSGEAVGEALTQEGLQYGDMRIFHRYTDHGTAFSVANVVEPGVLDPDELSEVETPGLAVFMQLPGPQAPLAAFDDMVATAHRLAETLGGEVRDETRSALTRQTVEHLRESIQEFERRSRVGTH